MNWSYYFLLYIVYSILGWLIEVFVFYLRNKKIVNRGFLIGPYCPIYGVGALLVIFLLRYYSDKPIGLFVMSVAICAIVEYLSSYILEKLFHTRWWDYTNRRFNINGRICLENLIPFGVGCIYIFYFLNPVLNKLLLAIPYNIAIVLAIIIFIFYAVDTIVSFIIIWNFKSLTTNMRIDNTEKVTKYVKNEIIAKKKLLYNRVIKAFPQLQVVKSMKKH